MREILFRGKRKGNGKWIYGFLVPKETNSYADGFLIIDGALNYDELDDYQPSYSVYSVVPETVGQYTGLTDKNGKKIFEGDIIRYADNDEYEMYLESIEYPEEYEGVDFSRMWTVDKVVYGDKIGYPAFDLNAHDFDCNGLAELSENGGQWFYEVIGNIHDNPELLEV